MEKVYAWRLAKAKYRESALDGVGSALGGGRWNSVGTPVVYCASTGSGAIPRKCMFFTGDWFSGLYAAKTAGQSSGAVTIFSVSGLMLN
jgi:RES domain-containing protein